MSEDWLGRLRRLVADQQRPSAQLNHRLAQAKKDLATAQDHMSAIEQTLKKRDEDLAAAMADLLEMRNDPIVLVRNYGAYRNTYHSADRPCGWVGRRQGYDRMLWGEARSQGFHACSACGWQADNAAERGRREDALEGRSA